MLSTSTSQTALQNLDEQSDAHGAEMAFARQHKIDVTRHHSRRVILVVRQENRTRTQCNGTRTRTRKDRDAPMDFRPRTT